MNYVRALKANDSKATGTNNNEKVNLNTFEDKPKFRQVSMMSIFIDIIIMKTCILNSFVF